MKNWYKFLVKIKPDGKAFRSIFFSKIFYEVLAKGMETVKDYAVLHINDQIWYVNDNFDPEPWERRYEISPPTNATIEERRQYIKTYMLFPQSQNRLSRDYIYDTLIDSGYEGVKILYNPNNTVGWIENTILESNDIKNDVYARGVVEGDIYCDGFFNVYCTFALKSTVREIVEYRSDYYGKNWTHNKTITSSSVNDNINPFYIRNKDTIVWFYGANDYGVGKQLKYYENEITVIDNITDASSLWLINNKGIYANGFTYVTYIDLGTNTRNILQYNHSIDEWSNPIALSTTSFVGGGNTSERDYAHASPSVMIDTNGYINVSYGGRKQGTLYNIRSANPNDISSWDSEVQIASGVVDLSYATMVEVDGDYVMFYRTYTSTPVIARKASTDNGSTWGAEVIINNHYPYFTVKVDSNDRIHLAWHYFDGTNNRDIYYAYCDNIKSATPTFCDATGASKTLPITPSDCKAFDSTILWDDFYIMGMDVDDNNNVHIIGLAMDFVNTDKLLHFTYNKGLENYFLHANDFGDEKNDFSIGSLTYNSFIISGELSSTFYANAIMLAMSLKPLQVAMYDKVEVLTAIAIDDSLAWALDDNLATALTTL